MTYKFRLDGVVGLDIIAEEIASEIKGKEALEITINSGGGSVLEGYAIFNLLNTHPHSITFNIDFAGSIASLIIMSGDTLRMAKNSSLLMIHKPWSGLAGNAPELRKNADILDKIEEQMIASYIEKSGIEADLLAQMLEDETWLNAQEALELGFIDEITDHSANRESTLKNAMRAHEQVSFDMCALVSKMDAQEENHPQFTQLNSLKDAEKALRASGFSRSEATHFVSSLKTLLIAEDKADTQQSEQARLLADFADTLKNL